MQLKKELEKRNIDPEELASIISMPISLLNDILEENIELEDCAYKYLKGIANVLRISVDFLVYKYEMFQTFRNNLHHELKDKGDLALVYDILKGGSIDYYYYHEDYPKAFYLLALVDFLSKKHGIDLCTNYNEMRFQRLEEPFYIGDNVEGRSFENCIEEFKKYNIFEGDLYDAV